MGYSTEAEFRANVSIGTASNIVTATVVDRIAVADKHIETDFSNIINFSAIVATPDFINLLSQYKTAELCLVYMYGKKRKLQDNSDIDYWKKEYNKLKEQILSGEIALEDGGGISIGKGSQTFENEAKDNIEPALGVGDYSGWKTKEELEKERPID